MRFAEVSERLGSTGFTTPWLGRQLYDAVVGARAVNVLEIGTAHGAGTSYLAGAVHENGGGRVTTVDRYHFANPAPEETLANVGLTELVEFVRVDESSYTWWLKDRWEEGRQYDFCFLDGAHDWHIDGLAVVLVERMLEQGAWLVLDDLDWTYRAGTVPEPPNFSERERDARHVAEVFDALVKPNPAFTEMRVVDGKIGWARKGEGARHLRLETTTHRSDILTKRLGMAVKRFRGR